MQTPKIPSPPWIAALLTLGALVIFSPGLAGGFIFDDFSNLVLEDGWKLRSFAPQDWLAALHSGVASPAGRPLAIASFALNHVLTGMDPFWLKATGLAFHAFNGVLVYALSRALLRAAPHAARTGALAPALLAAAWALHPLQVSSALYVVQRMELGAATGTLLALLAYVRLRQSQLRGARAWPWLLAMGAAIVFGLGFKETAALAPGFAFLIELTLFRFRNARGGRDRVWLWAYGIGAALAMAAYARIVLPLAAPDSLYAIREFSLTERLWTQLPVLAMYLRQCLLPLPDNLWFYYDNIAISRGPLQPAGTAWAGALLLALLGVALACWRRWPLVTLGIGWFFMAHALTSNVIPLELAFEHRNYLALFGILLALVQPMSALGARLHADARAVLAMLPVIALATLCWIQAASWGDPLRLAWTLENRNPTSQRASYELAKELTVRAGEDPASPAWGMAHAQMTHAAALPGPSSLPLQGLLLIEGRTGRPSMPATWTALRERITRRALGPEGLSALFALSECRIQMRCRFDDGQLLQTFLAVLARNPDSPAVHTLYANFAWNVLGDRPLAIAMQREAVALAPAHTGYRVALAKFLLASGDAAAVQEGRAVTLALASGPEAGLLRQELAELDALSGAADTPAGNPSL